MLDKEALDELKRLLRQEYGYEHSDEEAIEIGGRLLRLFELLAQPIRDELIYSEAGPASTEERALVYMHDQIVHHGHSPSVREFSTAMGYRSSRSGLKLLDRLIEQGRLLRSREGYLTLPSELAWCEARRAAVRALIDLLRGRAKQNLATKTTEGTGDLA